jgi:hypothetical protein
LPCGIDTLFGSPTLNLPDKEVSTQNSLWLT